MRAAVYYAPPPDDRLWSAAAVWLGRDAETAATVPQPPIEGLFELTADPRLYGFHATLKPPMKIATSWDALVANTDALAGRFAPFTLPPLRLTSFAGFLALNETAACPPLQALADACVVDLDAHRAPPDAEEMARRRRAGLSEAQERNMVRWGYPHVLDTWFFHMTLTKRLTPEQDSLIRPEATRHFTGLIETPRPVRDICLFVQEAPGEPFRIAQRFALRG